MKQKSLTESQAKGELEHFLRTGDTTKLSEREGYSAFVKPLGVDTVVSTILQAMKESENYPEDTLRFAIPKCIFMLERDFEGPSASQYTLIQEAALERAAFHVKNSQPGAIRFLGYPQETRAWTDLHLYLHMIASEKFRKATLPPIPSEG